MDSMSRLRISCQKLSYFSSGTVLLLLATEWHGALRKQKQNKNKMNKTKHFPQFFPSFSMADRIFADFDDLLKDSGRLLDGPYWYEVKNTFTKPVIDHNVNVTETAHVLEIPVPGIKQDQVSVTFNDGTLYVKIQGESKWTKTADRKFTLPEGVNADHITASVTDGVLTVTVPKTETEKPKEVKIL